MSNTEADVSQRLLDAREKIPFSMIFERKVEKNELTEIAEL